MLSYIIKVFLLVHITDSFEVLKQSRIHHVLDISPYDTILCRSCGADIASANYLFSISSPASQYSFNDSLFNKDEVLVQVLSSDIFFNYPVITSTLSTCVGLGEWEENDSWFLGYHWKPCVCPECGAHLGWVFEPVNQSSLQSPRTFFGLILSNLIGEAFISSLTLYPGRLSN